MPHNRTIRILNSLTHDELVYLAASMLETVSVVKEAIASGHNDHQMVDRIERAVDSLDNILTKHGVSA